MFAHRFSNPPLRRENNHVVLAGSEGIRLRPACIQVASADSRRDGPPLPAPRRVFRRSSLRARRILASFSVPTDISLVLCPGEAALLLTSSGVHDLVGHPHSEVRISFPVTSRSTVSRDVGLVLLLRWPSPAYDPRPRCPSPSGGHGPEGLIERSILLADSPNHPVIHRSCGS